MLLVEDEVAFPVPDPVRLELLVGLKESVVDGLVEAVLPAEFEAVGVSPELTVPDVEGVEVCGALPVPVILDVPVFVIVTLGV